MQAFLDLQRYPLDRPHSEAWQALVDQCREELAEHGMFNLPGLMHAAVAEQSAQALEQAFANDSFRHERAHNIYFLKSIPALPDDHPALRQVTTSNNTLCGDQAVGTPMEWLYHWAPFAQFLAATMDKPALYPMDDALAGFNVMSYHEGQRLNWHFDRSEFTTTLLLQAPEQGGEFVYRSDLRSDDDPNYDGVATLLRGEDPEVRRLGVAPGTLNVFRGKNTPHRVEPTVGPKARVITVFSYYETAGKRFSDEENIGFYGRAS